MDLFDPEIALSERMRAAEMLYARCSNPLDFWLQALPKMPAMQVGVTRSVDHSFTLRRVSHSVVKGYWFCMFCGVCS